MLNFTFFTEGVSSEVSGEGSRGTTSTAVEQEPRTVESQSVVDMLTSGEKGSVQLRLI